jgi:protein ImuA
MHEILGLAARRFAVGLLARRLGQTNAPAIWVMPAAARHSLYGPGLVSLGVDPGRVIIARYKTTQEGLWSLEEALKSGAFSMVLGEPEGVLSTIAARRLQLAAETGAALGLLLSERQIPIAAPGSATSRWHADFAPALVPTPPLIEENKIQRRLALTLDRHRGACGDPTLGATHWTVDIAG